MPMTAAEKLISLSSINGCATAATHFCAATNTGSTIEKRVYDNYKLRYVPETPSEIKYVAPSKMSMRYIPVQHINIRYMPTDKSAIKYIAPNTIKIKHQCKP